MVGPRLSSRPGAKNGGPAKQRAGPPGVHMLFAAYRLGGTEYLIIFCCLRRKPSTKCAEKSHKLAAPLDYRTKAMIKNSWRCYLLKFVTCLLRPSIFVLALVAGSVVNAECPGSQYGGCFVVNWGSCQNGTCVDNTGTYGTYAINIWSCSDGYHGCANCNCSQA